MRQRLFITTIAVLICVISSYAQGLYSKSLSVTELKGVWTNGTVTVETDNAIASTKKSDYVKSHLYEYKNIVLMTTEKMEYKDKTYYIWEIMYDTEGIKAGESASIVDFLALTEAQNNQLKNISTKDVSIVQIPNFFTVWTAHDRWPEKTLDGIKKAILEKDDFSANTYTITARKDGAFILFNYDVDVWTYKSNINNRTYERDPRP